MLFGLASLSIALFIIIIPLGFFFRINLGILGLTAASLLIAFAKLDSKILVSGWPVELFILLLGMSYLFGILRLNGTLEAIAAQLIWIFKNQTKLLLPIFLLLTIFLAALGPGNIVVCAIITPIALVVLTPQGFSPLLVITMIPIAANMGGLSPIAPTGIIAVELAKSLGMDLGNYIFIRNICYNLILLLAYGAVSFATKKPAKEVVLTKPEPFRKEQIFSLLILILVVSLTLFAKLNIGTIAFFGATLLLILTGVSDQKLVRSLPWETLLMISGMSVYTYVMTSVGAIDLLADFLCGNTSTFTAKSFLAGISGLLSLVSSASGVVMPTLFPTVSKMASTMGGIRPESLMLAIVVGAHAVTNSPLSTLGALSFASIPDTSDRKKLFGYSISLAILNLLVITLLLLV